MKERKQENQVVNKGKILCTTVRKTTVFHGPAEQRWGGEVLR